MKIHLAYGSLQLCRYVDHKGDASRMEEYQLLWGPSTVQLGPQNQKLPLHLCTLPHSVKLETVKTRIRSRLHSYSIINYLNNIITYYKMSFFDKIKDTMHVNGFKQFLHRESNEIFAASIVKISTFNKGVFDSEWALTSRPLMLVCTW